MVITKKMVKSLRHFAVQNQGDISEEKFTAAMELALESPVLWEDLSNSIKFFLENKTENEKAKNQKTPHRPPAPATRRRAAEPHLPPHRRRGRGVAAERPNRRGDAYEADR
jgi:hypothetical protein